jgi:ABC-2 type transport system ATP-binding protein
MIELTQVSKQYGQMSAVSNLSFTLETGVFGLLGPNGAGKSTTLRLVTGYLGPSSGAIRVFGEDPLRTATRERIGYLPEGAPLLPEATVAEILHFAANAKQVERSKRSSMIRAAVERLGLGDLQHRLAETLSKGQRRRVALAAAVIGDPPVLVLDEPTDGLDPNQREDVHLMIRELAPSRTILLSTHILEEAERICDRALILSEGQLLADGAPANLAQSSHHHKAVRIELLPDADAALIAQAVSQLPSVRQIKFERHGRHLIVLPRSGQTPFVDIANLVAQRQWPVEGLHVQAGRLEEIFRTLTSARAGS